jgi:hypothetical protein
VWLQGFKLPDANDAKRLAEQLRPPTTWLSGSGGGPLGRRGPEPRA